MTITVYSNFSKRRNSTARPTGAGTQKTVVLKEGTSIESPTFVLKSNDFTINYVNAFNHYYFVDDIVSVRDNLIEVKCSMDVLATYKTAIGNYNAFIERAASSSIVNTLLPDPLVSVENDERILQAVTSGLGMFSSSGYYILSVINSEGSGAGFTSYYMIDITKLNYVANYCNTAWDSGNPNIGLTDWIQSTFLKTSESIISCIWVPFSLAATTGLPMTNKPIVIGVDQIGESTYHLNGICIASETLVCSIPSTGYSDFRRGAPYTIGKVFIPCYGMVDFNPLDFLSGSITMKFDADIATGDVTCYLCDGSTVVSSYTYNVAVNCPVGKVGADVKGTATGLLSTVGSIIGAASASTGAGALAGGLAASASGINTLATALGPTVSVKGSQGGRALAERGTDPIIILICRTTTDPADLLTHHGGLVMEKKTIGNYSGYIKCSNASLSIDGMGGEKEAVNNYLNSGFYYE